MSNESNVNKELDNKIQEWLNWDQVCINDNSLIESEMDCI
jgi:hypothetical protein